MSKNIKVKFNGNVGTMPLWSSTKKIKALLNRENFDIIHVQMPYSPFMASKVIKYVYKRSVIVGTFHIAPNDALVSFSNKVLGLILRKSLKKFNCFLSVSSAAQSFAKQTFGINSKILPNVVDYELFNSANPLEQYDGDIINILFLGRLVPRKGCKTLLEAINIIKNDVSKKVRVIVCGKGHLLSSLKQYVEHNDLKNIVKFVGYVTEEDKPKYYKSADIAVFPSSGGESFGIVLLEAMATGNTAVLAGDNAGYRSVISVKEELLFEPNNPNELANKLKNMIENEAYRKEIITWQNDFIKDFDINNVGNKLLRIYERLLQKS